MQLWPILRLVNELKDLRPFVIALFAASHKPVLEEYFLPFVDEKKRIAENGITINGKVFQIVLDAIICNAPARAFMKGIKSHSGYYACERYNQQGEWDGRPFYSEKKTRLRTDASFRSMLDEEHQ